MDKFIFTFAFFLLRACLSAQVSLAEIRAFFIDNPTYYTDGFDFPVGPPDAKGYYNAQPFTQNNHLGDDWNGKGGGNTDLGDPVYSCANGYVVFAQNLGGGWGNVVRVAHVLSLSPLRIVESVYAHLDQFDVREGQALKKGEKLGTIGNAGGLYYAHLHFEIRSEYGMPIGGGYSNDTTGYLNPTQFIRLHRK